MRLPTLRQLVILSGALVVFLFVAVLVVNRGREPLLSGPFDAYISGQKETRATGCLEAPLSSESQIYVNALWVVDPPSTATEVRITGMTVMSEPFVEVDQAVELTHIGLLAPPFAHTNDSILDEYETTPLPTTISVERTSSQALSFGVIVSVDPSMLPESPTPGQGVWSLGIEAVTYEDSTGQEFVAEVTREISIVFTDTPILDLDTACADVTRPS